MLQVACAVIMKENRILCAQRSERMRHPLKWEFPGGKVEKDERLDLCIIREVKEELNLDIVVYKLLSKNIHDYGGGNAVCLHPFVCYIVSGDMALLEHKAIRWLRSGELYALDWVQGDLPVVDEVVRFYQ